MENIDDLMRQKFDSDNPSERFEFREEYWEQAQALLEQEEARRRRRWRWGWLFFTGLLGAIGLCTWLWAGQGRGDEGLSHNGGAGQIPESGISKESGTTSAKTETGSAAFRPPDTEAFTPNETRTKGKGKQASDTRPSDAGGTRQGRNDKGDAPNRPSIKRNALGATTQRGADGRPSSIRPLDTGGLRQGDKKDAAKPNETGTAPLENTPPGAALPEINQPAEQPSINNQPISNQQSTISNQQSTISNQQSTISNQQSTISNQQSTISNQQS
ncbi:MAG: hypothetical protein ACKVUS_20890, partial [Saprospiraceae bacterium]